jgi:hypothetical protein
VTRERLVLAATFLLCLPLVTPKIRGADEIEYFSYLHSAVFDHDLEFGNEYQYFYDHDPKGLEGFKKTFLDGREAATGRHINFGPLGTALLWAPFYLAAHVLVLVLAALGRHVSPDGLSAPYQAAACYASVLYGYAGLLLLQGRLLAFFPARAGLLATLGVFLGTPLLYYMTLAPGFSHAVSLFAVTLLLEAFFRHRGRPGLLGWAVVGAAGGLAGLVREQDALFLAIPLADLAIRALREREIGKGLLRAGAVLGASFLVFLPQRLVYHALNGSFGPSHLVARKLSFWSPHFLDVLLDPGHGLFVWSPLVLVAVLGLVRFASRSRDLLGAIFLLAFLLQVWINGSLESWTQAGAFGSRRFLSATPLFAFGLAALAEAALPRIGAAAAGLLLALFVWWNVSLMVQFGLKLMDRQRLEWPRVARNQVLEVPPRLLRVARLFLTDRERLVHEAP